MTRNLERRIRPAFFFKENQRNRGTYPGKAPMFDAMGGTGMSSRRGKCGACEINLENPGAGD